MTQYANSVVCANITEEKVRNIKGELTKAISQLACGDENQSHNQSSGTTETQRLASQIDHSEEIISVLETLCELKRLFEEFDSQLADGIS